MTIYGAEANNGNEIGMFTCYLHSVVMCYIKIKRKLLLTIKLYQILKEN